MPLRSAVYFMVFRGQHPIRLGRSELCILGFALQCVSVHSQTEAEHTKV